MTANQTTIATTAIVDIPHERVDEAATVLARAFEDYPLMHYILADSGNDYKRHVWDAMRFTCEARLTLGNSLKGVEENGRLVAVACIDHPEEKIWPDSLEQGFDALIESLSEQAATRFSQFGELVGAHHPQQPHFYLVVLGVQPEAQRQGYGRALLSMVQEMSESHPLSTGVGLDTETIANVPLYKHCGYQVTGEARLGDVDMWFFFRPNGAQ